MRARVSLVASLILLAPLAGCIVPENMTQLRQDLGYASVQRPDLVAKARASTLSPAVGETVTLTADVQGAPAANTTLTWTVDGTTHEGPTVERAFEAPGTVNVTVTARADGVEATDALTLDVAANEPPTASVEVPDRDALVHTEPVTLRANTSDPDGDELSHAWTLDGQPAGEAATVQASVDPGVHRASLEVTDGRATAIAEATFAVAHALDAAGNLSTGEATLTTGFDVREGVDGLAVTLEHTTTAGVDDVDLALVDAGGETVAAAEAEPEPGASTASETLTVDAGSLAPGSYALEATLERGSGASVTLEGEVAYAAGG